MLKRVDRLIVRVPNVTSAVRFYTRTLGLVLEKQESGAALLHFPEDGKELVLHSNDDLPDFGVYLGVENVRDLYARRDELGIQFISPPSAAAKGWRAVIKDPFGNVLMLMDQSTKAGGAIEDGRVAGGLFPGVESKIPVKREALIEAYTEVGRTADDLPYTPEFEKLFALYSTHHELDKPTRGEVWRQLLNLRKGGKLPRIGLAKSVVPEISDEAREVLVGLVKTQLGKRDRLPYTPQFEQIVDAFNKTQKRMLSPHLVWRLVASMAK